MQANSTYHERVLTGWGDGEIDDDAALTWVISTATWDSTAVLIPGLVISTAGYLHLKMTKMVHVTGLNCSNLAAARLRGVGYDYRSRCFTVEPPRFHQFLSDTVDQIIAYSEELE